MPSPTELAKPSPAAAIVGPIFGLAAAGEIGVGLAVLAFPGLVAGLLLNAAVEGPGLVVTRMLGIALAALGLTWWQARSELDQRLARLAPGFIAYNLGVGLLFLAYALSLPRPAFLPWLVAGVHLLLGLTLGLGARASRGASG